MSSEILTVLEGLLLLDLVDGVANDLYGIRSSVGQRGDEAHD